MTFPLRRFAAALVLAGALHVGSTHAMAQSPGPAATVLLPVDDAVSLPDFFTFRARLQAAVAKRDVAAITAALHRDVKLSFGGDDGVGAFAALWSPASPDTKLWETLSTVLALGGTAEGDSVFTAPYVFSRWPNERDAFDYAAILGAGVRVRRAPSDTAPVIASLDFAIVETVPSSTDDQSWVAVRLPSQGRGFVHRRFVRSPIDYRIRFAKRDGRWQIVFFLAGD